MDVEMAHMCGSITHTQQRDWAGIITVTQLVTQNVALRGHSGPETSHTISLMLNT